MERQIPAGVPSTNRLPSRAAREVHAALESVCTIARRGLQKEFDAVEKFGLMSVALRIARCCVGFSVLPPPSRLVFLSVPRRGLYQHGRAVLPVHVRFMQHGFP